MADKIKPRTRDDIEIARQDILDFLNRIVNSQRIFPEDEQFHADGTADPVWRTRKAYMDRLKSHIAHTLEDAYDELRVWRQNHNPTELYAQLDHLFYQPDEEINE